MLEELSCLFTQRSGEQVVSKHYSASSSFSCFATPCRSLILGTASLHRIFRSHIAVVCGSPQPTPAAHRH